MGGIFLCFVVFREKDNGVCGFSLKHQFFIFKCLYGRKGAVYEKAF